MTTAAVLATAAVMATPAHATTVSSNSAKTDTLSLSELTKATSTLNSLSTLMGTAANTPSVRLAHVDWQATAAKTSATDVTPYGSDSCTSFVWDYFHQLGIDLPPRMGNAEDWAAYANSQVKAGTIAVFPAGVDGAGGVGHVSVVTSVNKDGSFNLVEGNYAGIWNHVRTNVSPAGLSFINPLNMK